MSGLHLFTHQLGYSGQALVQHTQGGQGPLYALTVCQGTGYDLKENINHSKESHEHGPLHILYLWGRFQKKKSVLLTNAPGEKLGDTETFQCNSGTTPSGGRPSTGYFSDGSSILLSSGDRPLHHLQNGLHRAHTTRQFGG